LNIGAAGADYHGTNIEDTARKAFPREQGKQYKKSNVTTSLPGRHTMKDFGELLLCRSILTT
jgi:hypothetical protein